MKHFINLKDIPAKDLKKIISDAKKRKSSNCFSIHCGELKHSRRFTGE